MANSVFPAPANVPALAYMALFRTARSYSYLPILPKSGEWGA